MGFEIFFFFIDTFKLKAIDLKKPVHFTLILIFILLLKMNTHKIHLFLS
jgi:hypothetical protein